MREYTLEVVETMVLKQAFRMGVLEGVLEHLNVGVEGNVFSVVYKDEEVFSAPVLQRGTILLDRAALSASLGVQWDVTTSNIPAEVTQELRKEVIATIPWASDVVIVECEEDAGYSTICVLSKTGSIYKNSLPDHIILGAAFPKGFAYFLLVDMDSELTEEDLKIRWI